MNKISIFLLILGKYFFIFVVYKIKVRPLLNKLVEIIINRHSNNVQKIVVLIAKHYDFRYSFKSVYQSLAENNALQI